MTLLSLISHLPTWLGPVVEARVVVEGAERLWAKQTVTFQILAHVLQEPQHRRRTGGRGQLHVADTMFWAHWWHKKTSNRSACITHTYKHTHTHTVCIHRERKAADGSRLAPSHKHKPNFFHPIPHWTMPSHPSQACADPQINTCPISAIAFPIQSPEGNPTQAFQTRLDAHHFWLQTECSHQLLPKALFFVFSWLWLFRVFLKSILPDWLAIQAKGFYK